MSDQDDTTAPAREPNRRLTEKEWAEAKGLYETGAATKIDLAKKFGITRQCMREGLNKRGAVYGSKSHQIEAATVEGQKNDAQKKSEEIGEMREKRKRAIDLLDKLQNKAMSEALTASSPLSSKHNEFKTLNLIIKNTVMIRAELWEIYDLNRDPDGGEDIPEFIVSEYEPDEIAALNNQRLGISPEDTLEQAAAAIEAEEDLDDLLGE